METRELGTPADAEPTWAQPLAATLRGGARPWEDVVVPGLPAALGWEGETFVIARCERWR